MQTRGRTQTGSASPCSQRSNKRLIVKQSLRIGKIALLISGWLLVGMTSRVQATSIPWGDPVLGHSWDQLWVETSDLNFNNLIARIVAPPASTFEPPGFLGFSVNSWVVQSMTDREIRAKGADTGRLEFASHFNGLPTDYTPESPLVLDLFFFHDTTVVDSHAWVWNGSVWVAQPAAGIPDGGTTLLLLGLSSLGMAWLRKRLA